ncbi:polyprenyl synthetase family protein [Neorickettsia helminthoeca]|uniref:polyprenyl synthetase family protein n=1 Tax=Neorickettsia helminthoeca TaxID=33994 RepID=UPI000AED0888|nr:polyprenyl synthetase family protein [Neorickettsia helminthoeca]
MKKVESVEQLICESIITQLRSVEDAKKMVAAGKKVRALLALISFALCGNADQDTEIRAAATIELIHNATLMHDDVIDENYMRRGRANIKSIYGNKISVLTGDFILSVAFEIILECKNLAAVSLLSKTAKQLSEGEMLQLCTIGRIVTESEYLEIIGKKTAILFSAATEIAAILSNRKEHILLFREVGHLIGIAFQIIDDVIDYDSSSKIGKEEGNDFRESRFTLPCMIAYRDAKSKAAKKFWSEEFFSAAKNIEDARFFMNEVSAMEKASDIAVGYIKEAEKKLSIFRESPHFFLMQQFLKHISERLR